MTGTASFHEPGTQEAPIDSELLSVQHSLLNWGGNELRSRTVYTTVLSEPEKTEIDKALKHFVCQFITVYADCHIR